MFCVVAPFSESTLICMTSTYICYITSIRTYISNSKFNFKSNPAFNRWRTLVLAGKGIPIIMGGCTVVEWQSVVFSPIYCTYYEDRLYIAWWVLCYGRILSGLYRCVLAIRQMTQTTIYVLCCRSVFRKYLDMYDFHLYMLYNKYQNVYFKFQIQFQIQSGF